MREHHDNTDQLLLRPATADDAARLLAWRNDPVTRKWSHNSEEIDFDDHVRWLANTLQRTDRRIFIAEIDGVAVGTTRADFDGSAWELSWTVAPEARGRGLAGVMVRLLANTMHEPIRAEVRNGNIASEKIALGAGMQFAREVDGVKHFERVEQ